MTICDACLQHVKEKQVIRGNDYLFLTGLTSEMLKQLSDDDLQYIKQRANEGVMVCNDCKYLCQINDSGCTSNHKQNMKAYNFRIDQDKATVQKVNEELQRRKNIANVLQQTR